MISKVMREIPSGWMSMTWKAMKETRFGSMNMMLRAILNKYGWMNTMRSGTSSADIMRTAILLKATMLTHIMKTVNGSMDITLTHIMKMVSGSMDTRWKPILKRAYGLTDTTWKIQ